MADCWPRRGLSGALKLVELDVNVMGLRLDYVITATGEKRSDIIGRLEAGEAGEVMLTVLPIAKEVSASFVTIENMRLRKTEDRFPPVVPLEDALARTFRAMGML